VRRSGTDRTDDRLLDAIRELAVDTVIPSGSVQKTIDLTSCQAVSRRHSIPRREVEIAALSAGIVPVRYLRNIGTIGPEGQIALLTSKVVVVGIGGLGGTIARNLARVGVGALVLVDGDVFSEDNLNRQEFADEGTVGRSKVEVAAQLIGRINGACEVTTANRRVDRDDLVEILAGSDVAVDALDSIPSRFSLSDAAAAVGVPLVHGSVAGFIGQVSTLLPEDGGFSRIFGDRDGLPERGVEATVGNLPGVVGAVAGLQTVEVIKILTRTGEPLNRRLLFLDLETCVFDFFDL
jgi:molybdopterin/thiamine biosynthesis adenylyltransferase